MDEAVNHPHNAERATFTEHDGTWQPSPTPRLSRTPSAIAGPPSRPGANSRTVLTEWGIPSAEIDALLADATVRQT